MVEIRSEDFEWAAIDRMGKMLESPHPDFKTTHTYSNFSAILCWTMQRVRTQPVHPETDLDARQPPHDDPNFSVFDSIQLEMMSQSIEDFFGSLPRATDRLNKLTKTDEGGNDITALAFAIALRNAVAHGDGRKVKPVNRPRQLVGFEFTLASPRNFPRWACSTQLNRSAMAQIAGKMVDVFCENFRKQKLISESELSALAEAE